MALVLAAWYGLVEERLIAKRWGVVVPGRVYRSGQISRHLVEEMLRSHQIATVIDLNGFNRHNADQQVELAVAEYLEIDHHRFALAGDGTGSLDKYADAIAHITRSEHESKPILVHCGAGSNRTGGVIAAYRLLVRGDSVEQVQRELEAYDCTPATNDKLVPFLNGNLREIAVRLVERGCIARVPDPLPQLSE
jgi:protein tyrosine/serine phosphatase